MKREETPAGNAPGGAANRIKLKGGALSAPIPPALVTVADGDEKNVLTVAWTGILATVPPTTYVSVRPRRHSYRMLENSREFVLHLPPATLAKEVDFCGTYTGAKVDKFAKCNFTLLPSDEVAAPTIAECPLALECRVKEILPMGSHDVFVAEIVSVSVDKRLMDGNGKLRLDRAHLLAFGHGEYYALGERVGSFGFSAVKRRSGKRNPVKKKGNDDGKRR
ncbi:MAG: flavin reductase family protein [Clostridia bacterium]|nr:flavin reductase family protein [Clostridia bacterium]